MVPKAWISISNIKIYLETKFHPNRRSFVFWWSFWIQNGHHSKPTMAESVGQTLPQLPWKQKKRRFKKN
jgi:hypothetical protein